MIINNFNKNHLVTKYNLLLNIDEKILYLQNNLL